MSPGATQPILLLVPRALVMSHEGNGLRIQCLASTQVSKACRSPHMLSELHPIHTQLPAVAAGFAAWPAVPVSPDSPANLDS